MNLDDLTMRIDVRGPASLESLEADRAMPDSDGPAAGYSATDQTALGPGQWSMGVVWQPRDEMMRAIGDFAAALKSVCETISAMMDIWDVTLLIDFAGMAERIKALIEEAEGTARAENEENAHPGWRRERRRFDIPQRDTRRLLALSARRQPRIRRRQAR